MKKAFLVFLILVTGATMSVASNNYRRIRWEFEPSVGTDSPSTVTYLINGENNVLGFGKWYWDINQTVVGDTDVASPGAGHIQSDSIQFTLWGWQGFQWDSLESFPFVADSVTTSWPKHKSLDMGTDADTVYAYEKVEVRARFRGPNIVYQTKPKYIIRLVAKE